MTPAQKCNAIAEACGWTKIHLYEDNAGPSFWSGIPPVGFKETFRQERKYGTKIPEYLTSLDAMHEAEAVLNEKQRRKYCQRLWQVNGQGGKTVHWRLTNATAAQRAEAFLRTLGKWEDGK